VPFPVPRTAKNLPASNFFAHGQLSLGLIAAHVRLFYFALRRSQFQIGMFNVPTTEEPRFRYSSGKTVLRRKLRRIDPENSSSVSAGRIPDRAPKTSWFIA